MRDKVSVVRELATAVATQEGPASLAERLAHAAVALVQAAGASITIAYTRPHRVTLCSTDDIAARLENLQDVLGEGPGPTAYRTGHQVRAVVGEPGTPVDPRWGFLDAAVRESLPAVWLMAVPIRPHGRVLGVLTCHQAADEPRRLRQETTQFLADAMGVALLQEPDQLATDLSGSWATQVQVHHATGMVVAQLGIGPDEALALLRAHAFAESSPLASVAAAVVSRELNFDESEREPAPAPESLGPRSSTTQSEGMEPP